MADDSRLTDLLAEDEDAERNRWLHFFGGVFSLSILTVLIAAAFYHVSMEKAAASPRDLQVEVLPGHVRANASSAKRLIEAALGTKGRRGHSARTSAVKGGTISVRVPPATGVLQPGSASASVSGSPSLASGSASTSSASGSASGPTPASASGSAALASASPSASGVALTSASESGSDAKAELEHILESGAAHGSEIEGGSGGSGQGQHAKELMRIIGEGGAELAALDPASTAASGTT